MIAVKNAAKLGDAKFIFVKVNADGHFYILSVKIALSEIYEISRILNKEGISLCSRAGQALAYAYAVPDADGRIIYRVG